jgi:hypothetical protein
MEILSDVLRAIRLSGALFFDVEAKATWVAETPAMPKIAHLVMPDAEHVIGFHAVLSPRLPLRLIRRRGSHRQAR